MAEKFDLPDFSPNPGDPNYKPAISATADLQRKLHLIFVTGQLDSLTDEELLTALYVIHNTGSSHPPDAVRALTINHFCVF